MDTRRGALAVPKVRRVGFFTSIEPPTESSSQRPNRSQSGPVEATTSSSPLSDSPSGNLISPVLIPPSRHHSDNLTSRAAAAAAAFRRYLAHDRSLHVGSYNPPDSLLGTSPPSSNGEFSEDSVSMSGFQRSDSAKLSMSFPNGGFYLTLAVRAPQDSEARITTASASEGKKKIAEVSGKSESVATKSQKVPVSKLEHGLRINNASPTDCEDSQCVVGFDGLFGHEEAMLQVSVQARAVVLKKSEGVTNNQVAHQLFDKMPLRVQSKRRHLKCHKSWMFKFKQRKQHRGKPRTAHKLMNRENVMEDYHVYQEGLPLWLLVRFKFWKFKFIHRKLQKMMREHGYSSHLKLKSDVGEDDEMFTGAKAVSMRFLLGIMLGIIESDAGQGQQAKFEQVVMTNVWLQTSLVTQQVMRSKKIKFPKRWMFKYKYVEEDIKSLHNQLSYMSRLELEEMFKSWSQRETV